MYIENGLNVQIRVSPLFNVCGMVEASIKIKQKAIIGCLIVFYSLI